MSSTPRRSAISPVGMVNGFDPAARPSQPQAVLEMIDRRDSLLGPGYQLFYEDPLEITRARDVFVYGADGTEYLDAYNNVAQIGHCHPTVVAAVTHQLGTLNTNTRYLQRNILDVSERILATMPDSVDRITYTCSGSEANDLAVRIANYHTGTTGLIVTGNAYHGVTASVAAFSPSLGPSSPLAPHVRVIEAPDPRHIDPGRSFEVTMRTRVRVAADDLARHGYTVSALIVDSVFSSDGLYTHPITALHAMADEVRQAGGLFIADEVQAGFGRTGGQWWGFQRHDVEPDIVTLGKPMGNGYPVAAVALREQVGREFGSAVRYFNTFGGSTVAMVAAAAVVDVIESEDLVGRSGTMGASLGQALRSAFSGSHLVTEIRGVGMFHGVEMCGADGTSAGGAAVARAVVNEARRNHLLISASGPHGNVLKIRPPLTFQPHHVDRLVNTLATALDTVAPTAEEAHR